MNNWIAPIPVPVSSSLTSNSNASAAHHFTSSPSNGEPGSPETFPSSPIGRGGVRERGSVAGTSGMGRTSPLNDRGRFSAAAVGQREGVGGGGEGVPGVRRSFSAEMNDAVARRGEGVDERSSLTHPVAVSVLR